MQIFTAERRSPFRRSAPPGTARSGCPDSPGASIDHLVASVNFGNEESLNYFHRTLRRMGVIDALREAGAGEGSTVCIGEMEFDFVE